jgi:RNA polymerase sigma-70 factor (ECF subfamily)
MVSAVDPLSRLAQEARAGNARALESLVGGSYDQVWRLCAGLVGGQRADDLAQETFVQAVRALPRFRGESSARTWLLAIARHVCLDELRAAERRSRRDGAMRCGRHATAGDASGDVAVADLLGRLGPGRRAAFVLTQLIGLSYDEAAQVCECAPGTIRSRVARARAELVDLLQLSEEDRLPGRSSSA